MLTVSSVSYSYLLNGSQFGRLVPERGLRQGDPLSPYLFICVVEAFIASLARAETVGHILGVRVAPTAPSVSTLCFADDTMIFCRATVGEAERLRQLLDTYAKASGQVINFEKSSMSFSRGVHQAVKNDITSILGVQVVEQHEKYLGMPAVVGKSKQHIFSFLRDRVWKRINGWGERTLSSAGKEVLIKAMLQSIPTYIMSCFLLPGYLINSIEAAIRSSWWNHGPDKKLAWLSWDKMYQPKRSGGLGFRNLRYFNLSLLAKQCWRLLVEPDSLLGRIFKARYFPNRDFMAATVRLRPSATWHSILKARPFLEQGIRVRIGNGYTTAIWGSDWIPETGNFKVITPWPQTFYPIKVADLIDPISGRWDVEMLHNTFWEVDKYRILAIPLGSNTADDKLVWHYSNDGKFSVRSCYHLISSLTSAQDSSGAGATSGLDNLNWKEIWSLPIPPKIRMFLWRACSGILPHKAELFRRHVLDSPLCNSCGNKVETTNHVLMECRGMREIWKHCPFNLPVTDSHTSMWQLFQMFKRSLQPDLFLVGLVICWKVWEVRNLELHGDPHGFPSNVYRWSSEFLQTYHEAQVPSSAVPGTILPSSWEPPARDVIKVNVDAAFPGILDVFHTSLVARDFTGKCVWWRRRVMHGRPAPSDEEAVAVLRGVQESLAKGWRKVLIETDCLPVYRYLRDDRSSLVSYEAVLDSCLSLRSSFQTLSFSFVKRT